MAVDPKSLLVDFPLLEPLIDEVRFANARITRARLWDDGDGLALCLTFEFESRGMEHRLHSMEDIASLFKVAGVRDFERLIGACVRVEYVSRGSWLPFFRIRHIVDLDPCMVLVYGTASLERFAIKRMDFL